MEETYSGDGPEVFIKPLENVTKAYPRVPFQWITEATSVPPNVTEQANISLIPISSGDSSSNCGIVNFVIYGPVYGIIILFGLLGNSLSFAVLHRGKANRKSVSTLLLKALAVTDNLFLFFASMAQMFPAMAIYFKLEARLAYLFPYVQGIVWPFTHIAQMETTWMMVMVAANRFVAVCKPLRAQTLCTMTKIHVQMAVMTVAVIAYNVPRFFEYRYIKVYKINEHNVTVETEDNIGLTKEPLYNIIYENISYWIFVFLSPLLILIYLNFHLVRELNRAKHCRQALTNRHAKEENNITLVMIIIIVIFIVCQAPASINQILWYVLDDTHKAQCTSYMYFFHVSNLLITMNSSINFVIYCVFRRQFRRQLWVMCGGKKKHRYQAKFSMISPSTCESELGSIGPVTLLKVKENGQQNAFHTSSQLYD